MSQPNVRGAPLTADLEIWLQRRDNGPHEAVVSFRPPGSSDVKDLSGAPRTKVQLDRPTLLEASLNPTTYGDALQQMIFAAAPLTLALNTARNQALGAQVSLRIRLRLDADDPKLYSIRWETMLDPIGSPPAFIAANAGTLFSRYLSSNDPTPVTIGVAGEITALVVGASPTDLEKLPPFDVKQAIDDLLPALADTKSHRIDHASFKDLTKALLDEPDILYLIAHGAVIDNEPWLYLEKPGGVAEAIGAADFTQALRNLTRRPLLIVLASCRSAGTSNDDRHALVALGPRLAAAGVGAVVAMHDDISQETVNEGMPIFFAQLLRHGRVDLAMAAMRSTLVARRPDWWQPVLYLRLDDGRLFTPPDAPSVAAVAEPDATPPRRVLPTKTLQAIERQQRLIQLIDKKIAFYEEKMVTEASPAVQFQLEQEMAELRARRARFEAELARLLREDAS